MGEKIPFFLVEFPLISDERKSKRWGGEADAIGLGQTVSCSFYKVGTIVIKFTQIFLFALDEPYLKSTLIRTSFNLIQTHSKLL